MRRLPPLTALEAFVQVARLGSVKAAAEELARRGAELQRHLGGHRVGVGAAAHPVGSKEFPAHRFTRLLFPAC